MSALIDSLNEYLDDKQEEKPGFKVDDKEKANWALRKIKQLKGKQEEVDNLAEKEINKIKMWQDKENNKLDNEIEFFEGMLEEYARDLKNDDADFKTLKLPSGDLKFRKQRPKYIYDNEKLISYAEENFTDLVEVKKRVSKRELKKSIDIVNGKAINVETGEIVEGIEVKERGERFSIKIK